MRQKVRNRRFTMSLMFSVVVLIALFATMVIVAGVAFVLLENNVFALILSDTEGVYILIAILVIASMVVGTISSSFALQMPLTPVTQLIVGLDRLAAGEYGTRIDPRSKVKMPITQLRAMRQLANSFNALAMELESTELLRSDFINDFSHEFKTPIVSIAGFARLLKREDIPEEQRREYLDIIESESMRLSVMATNVLKLTKVENQSILTDVSALNLAEQLRTCVLMLEARWEAKRLDMELELDELTVCANEELLKEVWINLLDNAVKFAPEGSAVRVTAAAVRRGVEVSVENAGPGISPEAQAKIFNKFYQADESHAAEGNGVGLAIVKRVVALHGGEVSVSSENGRTVFTVFLPGEP